MLDAIDATIEALARKDDRETRNFGLGATDGSLKLINRYFSFHLELFQREIASRTVYGNIKDLLKLNPEILTLAALEYTISSFEGVRYNNNTDMDSLSKTLFYIGHRLYDECYGAAFRAHLADEAEQIENVVKKSAGNLKYRQRLLKQIANGKGFEYPEWTQAERLKAAALVIDVLCKGPLFCIDEDKNLTMTPEALAEVEDIMADLVLHRPRCMPQTGEIVPWTGPYLHLECLRYAMVRTPQKAVRKFVEREFRAGSMGATMEALNHAQSVLWRINEPMLDLVRWCYMNNLGSNVGLPALLPLDVPEKNPDDPKVTRERREKRQANRGFIGERVTLERTLALAESLKGSSFWTPMNLDYRGRVYAIPHLNFQGADHMRAMFLFEEGQVLTEEGLYWLKVHVANTGAFDKVDKAPFDARVKWVDDNLSSLLAFADRPRELVPYWEKADSPFMFVAACKALADALEGKPCHMPVSFDGTCSGLQHLCAMTRAPEGSLVNLTPSDAPQDVYMTVAKRVEERITADLGGEHDDYAKAFIGFGITRSLVKRNVMTYAYSSKARGMTDQILEDTVRPLNFKVLIGELPEHPLGVEWLELVDQETGEVKRVNRHWHLASYLAKHTYAAIEEVVQGPARAMSFLRDIAGQYAHEEKATVWHTPLGFPVMMRYPNIETVQVNLFLHDKGLRLRPSAVTEVHGIKKDKSKNGISPSFVHSMDACHLMMVLLECKNEDIKSIALVHDSFGCLPNACAKFRHIIKQTFRDLYEKNNVLEDIRKEAEERLENNTKLPAIPYMGTLDLGQVIHADYCFA